jgi:hypothetical protein
MKKLQLPNPTLAMLGVICLSIAFTSIGWSQTRAHTQPVWSSAESYGNEYWVIETSIYPSEYSILQFYDRYNHLMYEQKVEGTRLSLNRKNIKMLNQALKKFNEKRTIISQLLIKIDPNKGGSI